MTILVFGSINMDLVTRVGRLPIPGETILGQDFTTVPGGKGANQAVAIARLGFPTQMVGRVGADDFGQALLQSLQQAGVQIQGVAVDPATHSGVALIAVADKGKNQIVVVPGVNGRVDQREIEQLSHLLPGATAILLQFEIPLAIAHAAARIAQAAGVSVILDPAPVYGDIPPDFYPLVDILTPNEIEAGQLVGFPVGDPQSAAIAAAELQHRGVKTVIIKLGAQGAFCATVGESFLVPAFPVLAVDTVAAGDAFNGGLAVALAEGLDLRQAVQWGAAVGALSATQPGAQPSMPDRPSLNRFLQQRGVGRSD